MARPMTVGKVVLDRLLDSDKPLTAKEAGGDPVIMGRLERTGRVQRVKTRKTEGRGRPPITWKLDPKVRKNMRAQIRRDAAKVTKSTGVDKTQDVKAEPEVSVTA